MTTYGSVCSGIEAATVAMEPAGWKASWFAEIEPFPCQVLKHHYPETSNLGDMTKIAAQVRSGDVDAPDVLVGGTPCQAFSVAGLRQGMKDQRGQLTLSFVELANEIDAARSVRGLAPCVVWWENVPGVLSDRDNAFGCFLGALAGEDGELQPPGKKWPNAGCVFGPERAVAWRILDAQYFGVAQRRRRVFVVASARNGFHPAAVLFEFDGLRRDSAPSREAWQDTAGTLASRTGAGGFPGTDEACSGYLQPVTSTLDASFGRLQGCSGQDANHGHSHLVAVSVALRGREGGATAELGDDIAGCLRASTGGGDKPHVLAFDCKASGQNGFGVGEIASTMRSMNSAKSHSNGGGHLAVCVTGDITHTLKAEGFDASENGTGRGQPIIAFKPGQSEAAGAFFATENYSPTLQAQNNGSTAVPAIQSGIAVRRLIPVECERLQGFPDNYSRIPVKKAKRRSAKYEYEVIDGELWQIAADGPRYKALGNSMAVPCMRWIGLRIAAQMSRAQELEAA